MLLPAVVLPIAIIAFLLMAGSHGARADLTITGDWVVSGSEFYADQVITIANNSTAGGNVSVQATGDLHLENVTLVLPFQSTLDVQGRAEVRNATVMGETWKLWIRGQAILTNDTLVNATFGGTVVESSNSTFDRLVWDCGGSAGTVHIRRPIDFRNNTLQKGCTAAYELASITVNKAVEIAFDTILAAGSGTAITFADAYHTGQVQFDLHDLVISNMSGWGVLIGQTAPNTTFLIHDSRFSNTGSAAIRADSFEGQLHVWNASFVGVLRAARMDGLTGGTVVGTLDNITVNGTTDSILANDMTWVISNSTINGANPQFDAGPNGHIRIYDSADNAFGANFPSAGGSIEHFIRLEMEAPTWQNAVPILGDLVTLLDANGASSLQVNASTWTPQEIVWWGMYPGGSKVDNRQLKPKIYDGGTAFNCTPAAFFVSPGMPLVSVTCTDDAPPSSAVLTPSFPRIQNGSLIAGTGRVDEAGSGLNTIEFSLDGSAYGPVSFAPGDARNFSFSRAGVADGVYRVFLRAVDRTGNVGLVTAGPITVDTVPPALAIEPLPPLFSGSSYSIAGTTEPNTSVTVSRAGGFTNTTTSKANGSFAVGILLEEGQNAYTVTARDAAGNTFFLVATTIVDTRPPSLAVLLDGALVTTALERSAVVRVEGMSEASAEVRVNGVAAARAGEAFSLDLPLQPGRTNLTVVATDPAGNAASWYGAAYYDDLPPELSASVNGEAAAAGSKVLTRSGSAAFSGTARDSGTGVASLLVNGKSIALDGSGGFSVAVALTEGENTIAISASDVVGNTASLTVYITRDSTAPGLMASVGPDASPIQFIGGAAYTNGTSAKVVLTVTENGTATVGGSSKAVQAGDNMFVVALVEGRNSFSIALVDIAGNAATPTTVIVVRDSLPPALSVASPAEGASVDTEVVEVVGSAEPLSIVRINGQAVTVSAAGDFRAAVPLALGANTLRIEANDAVGNSNSTTRTVTRLAPGSSTTQGAGGDLSPVLFLVVGLAAGVGLGLALSRSRRASEPREESPAETLGSAPKGPRGPRPPGA